MKVNEYIAKFVSTIDNLEKTGKNVPGLILSHAGFGKTSTIKKFCEYKNYNLITLIPSMYSADDILGLQTVEKGKLLRLTPSWFNDMVDLMKNGKRTLLFIDEITTCDPYIQGPLLDLIFNGNLGSAKLPKNVFIVAAGNYSDDLNNNFKMSAPLVNRFVILNLKNEDFDLYELLTTDFENITNQENLETFLGLKKDTCSLDYNNFKDWLKISGEVVFGSSTYEEDALNGLTGFTSVRSVSNILKFSEMYMSNYNDDTLWSRVTGDTLGKSNRREGKYMSSVLNVSMASFRRTLSNDSRKLTLEDYQKLLKETNYENNNIELFHKFIENVSMESLSMSDMQKISVIIQGISENYSKSYANKLTAILTRKMEL